MSRLNGPESESPVTDAGDIENLDSPATEIGRPAAPAPMDRLCQRPRGDATSSRSLALPPLAGTRPVRGHRIDHARKAGRPETTHVPARQSRPEARAGRCLDCPAGRAARSCGATCVGRNERRQRNQEDNDHEFVSRKSVDQRG